MNKIDTLGAVVSLYILSICILVFIFRLLGHHRVEYWLGIILLLSAIPLMYLLYTAKQFHRPWIYYIQVGIMTGFLVIELLLDYLFKLEFRNMRWMVVLYLIFFFGGTGGMIGIASQAGKPWTITAVLLFFIMTFLAFYQRAKTGM